MLAKCRRFVIGRGIAASHSGKFSGSTRGCESFQRAAVGSGEERWEAAGHDRMLTVRHGGGMVGAM
eukprot:2295557-Alexandrium_andersonii.AAC.1